MTLKRRNFLRFFGATASIIAIDTGKNPRPAWTQETVNNPRLDGLAQISSDRNLPNLKFQPLKMPLPLEIEKMSGSEQMKAYSSYEVRDDLMLPQGFTYDVIAAWGDRIGDSRFGYNNDYLSFRETAPNEGFLTINFEYISGKTWIETYDLVIGQKLPFQDVIAQTEAQEGKIDAFTLADNDRLKAQIKEISQEGLIDLGIGIISIRRNENGKWERTYSDADRRITGISGWDNPRRYLKSTGPATAIFTKQNKLGYEDDLGDRIMGTLQNCAGGDYSLGYGIECRRKLSRSSTRSSYGRRFFLTSWRTTFFD